MASGGNVARETGGRAAGDRVDYFILFPNLENMPSRRARGRARKGRAGRRTGERTHRGEYRGHVARLDGSEPARVAPGRGYGPLRWKRALRGSVQTTETERRPRRCRGSARSRPGTAATSGSEGLERGVGPSTARSPRARSVRRGMTARAVVWFSSRRRPTSRHVTRARGKSALVALSSSGARKTDRSRTREGARLDSRVWESVRKRRSRKNRI